MILHPRKLARRVCLLVITILFSLQVNADSPLQGVYAELSAPGEHYAYILETGADALLARIHLIRQAKQSINIQTFIWANDDTGRYVFYELLKAADRGVKVRVLIDDMSLRKSAGYVGYLATAHPNITIKQYNPLAENIDASLLQIFSSYTVKFGQTNRRMHNKTLIVDEKFGITGGRNYADDYFDLGLHRSFKDRDLLIVGPVVADMATSFEDYWAFELSVLSRDMTDVKKMIETDNLAVPKDIAEYEVPPLLKPIAPCADQTACMDSTVFSRGFRLDNAEFIVDKPGKVEKEKQYAATTQSLISLIEGAQTSVIIQTPYLVVGKAGAKVLKRVRKANPELEFLVSTNSLAAADHFYAYAFAYKNKKKYLKSFGWQLFELKPSPGDLASMVPDIEGHHRAPDHYTCIHAKTFVFDQHTVWLGSYNLDPRSASLNTEAVLLIKDDALATEVANSIRRDISPRNSWAIGVRQKLPVLAWVNGLVENISSKLPFLNVWPFRYATSFELKPGATPVPYYDDEFHNNYKSVGQFPGANVSQKALKARLTKAFFGPAEPII
jgi:putative cardiolipin synthase